MLIVTTINDIFKMQNCSCAKELEQNHPSWRYNTGMGLWPKTPANLGADQR